MNLFEDANYLYDAGTKAMNGSKWKYSTQLFEINHLLETAVLQKKLTEKDYHPGRGQKFKICERGKPRYITSSDMVDKTVYHTLSDDVLGPALKPYIIQENTASQKGKGVAMFRRQVENDLRRYYRVHRTNKGYILLTDFSGYYPNMNHDICKKQLSEFLDKSKLDAETITTAKFIIDGLFKTFETDVSRFSDDEIEKMYYTKIDPMMNCGVDPKLLTGEKMLRKGVDIGTQPSQDIGIIHPYKIDNCAKIVFSIEGYGRYTDDIRAISESKERLENLLEAIKKLADEIGLILGGNMRHKALAEIADMSEEEIMAEIGTLRSVQRKVKGEQEQLADFWRKWLKSPYLYAIRETELSEDDKREFVIKDNVHAGQWDYDMLRNFDQEDLQEWCVTPWSGTFPFEGMDGGTATDGNNNVEVVAPERERIIIIYPRGENADVLRLLGLKDLTKAVYRIDELTQQAGEKE